MGEVWTSGRLYDRIAAAHAPPEWACFPEIANGTGTHVRRHADALAMNLYPSRGLEIRGFEIKVSRGDLRRELKNPEKAESVARFCDSWWIVAPADVCKLEDLPLAWGLMVPTDKGLRTVRAATALHPDRAEPTRTFLAAVLRGASKALAHESHAWIRREEVQPAIDAAFVRGREEAPGHYDLLTKSLRDENTKLRAVAAGVGIDLSSPDWIYDNRAGKAAGEMMRIGRAIVGRYGRDLQHVISCLDSAAKSLEASRNAVAELAAVAEVPRG